MSEDYWESRFKNEGVMWDWIPADSAAFAMKLFQDQGIRNILIPGFGYGRNARLFYENGFQVTGIEISPSAIEIAKNNGLDCTVHQGSVTGMPFSDEQYDGIYCYALIHLLNKRERLNFLSSCFAQLNPGGWMLFIVASKKMDLYGKGKYVSPDRYAISGGLKVFFYDLESVRDEFSDFGLVECIEIVEPVRYTTGYEPLKMLLVTCYKNRPITGSH
jgi:SAM-dependent methyltransferase